MSSSMPMPGQADSDRDRSYAETQPAAPGTQVVPPVMESSDSWMADLAAAPALALGPSPGELVGGEYRIERRLGEGSMGLVYLATHAALERKVAIKLHRVLTSTAAERLLREARAVAKVEHENVLVVHDVGTWNEQVFVAMEYVEGWTARAWLEAQPRSWREIVAVYLAAGRGLAAAHARGLVHRDFKPDNVLVGRPAPGASGIGRVRVADFGLARMASEGLPTELGSTDAGVDSHTLTDGIVGSPAYMAPEQYRRSDVDARADQFSFCVALFEGLAGRRPFAGETVNELAGAISLGVIEEPLGSDVPAHVRRVLRRGLRADPQQRYPDMDALLAELASDPIAARRRRLGIATAITATGLITWAVMRRPDPMLACLETPAIATWWTPQDADALRAALRASGRAFADDSFTRIEAAFVERGKAASEALHDACTATLIDGSRSRGQLEAERECLTQRGRESRALLEILGRGDPEIVDRAVTAVDALTSIERCRLKTGDDDLRDVDAALEPELDAALVSLAEVTELRATGRFQEAITLGEARVEAIRALAHPRLEAQLLLDVATAYGSQRDTAASHRVLQEANIAAVRAGADLVAAEIALEGIHIDGYLGASEQLGDLWCGLAEAWIERVGAPSDLRRELLANRALARRAADRLTEAVSDNEAALALLDEDPTASELERAGLLAALGATYQTMGRTNEAVVTLEAAIASYAASVGESHPFYANALNLLGAAQINLGDFAGAERSFSRAIEIGERALGPGSLRVLQARANLGIIYVNTGRIKEAIAVEERALADMRAAGRPDNDHAAILLSNLALAYDANGEGARARATQAEAIDVARKFAGDDSLLYAQQLVVDADMQLAIDPTRSLAQASRAAEIMAPKLEPASIQRIAADLSRAMALAKLGRCTEALKDLERGLPMCHQVYGAESVPCKSVSAQLAQCKLETLRPPR